ncbi:hypothetical protein QBC37DRAFT_10712 [Rhypophila decipiens]|uniref:Uncharacterized protein n=1 Tax=Rhypophila decipiens TaxID=261697 RepID=A0AAN7B6B1_9PEZI|nr:hypothetical protein QBC37DRAFT_10712 [Rhypophila decipiens]
MGLRLYQPPVESDIKARPSAEKILSHSRGITRHSRIGLNSEQQQERRRRVLTSFESRLPPRDAPTGTTGPSDAYGATGNGENGRHSLRDVAHRVGILDERVVAMFGERWAHLHADTTPFREVEFREADADRTPPTALASLSAMAVEPDFFPRRTVGLPAEHLNSVRRVVASAREAYALSNLPLSNLRSTQAPNRSPYRQAPAAAAVRIRRGQRERERNARRRAAAAPDSLLDVDLTGVPRRPEAQRVPEPGQVDGLGDRNRSLSPEGDNVWHTLLSTLTPDPTPPSVGSSFASASGPASASQSAATRSSATSFTGPDAMEDPALEQPCESACENSDTEGDEEEEAEQNPLTRFPPTRRADQPRTYADVVSRSSSFDEDVEDRLEVITNMAGMQRIVRTLADREDLPDEWWAQVGLSRTLARGASTS